MKDFTSCINISCTEFAKSSFTDECTAFELSFDRGQLHDSHFLTFCIVTNGNYYNSIQKRAKVASLLTFQGFI